MIDLFWSTGSVRWSNDDDTIAMATGYVATMVKSSVVDGIERSRQIEQRQHGPIIGVDSTQHINHFENCSLC